VDQLSLEIVEGTDAGRRVAVVSPLTVGRAADADLVLADELVSRRHARVSHSGADAVVEDLGSRNGTFVNGNQIHGPTRLVPGDQHVQLAAELLRGGDGVEGCLPDALVVVLGYDQDRHQITFASLRSLSTSAR